MAADSLPGQMRSAATTLLAARSEEHTSELLSHVNLVCRLLLEKKNCSSRRRASAADSCINCFVTEKGEQGAATILPGYANASRSVSASIVFFFSTSTPPRSSTLFPYTTLFR